MEYLEQLRHAGLFDARVPRYTSYPPVSALLPGEGALNHRRWLNAVPNGSGVSVYLHIPYCERLCWFCACRTQAKGSDAVVATYLTRLMKEITLVRAELPDQITLSRLYLGGGTPTVLDPAQIKVLLDSVYAAFPRSADFECLVEIDTTRIETAQIDMLLATGMTRAVVGVQDFDPTVQTCIGKQQSFEQVSRAVRLLRQAGLQGLDIEMLYGLPSQTTAAMADTTQQVMALEPDRVSVSEYAHIPHVAKRQVMIDANRLPASEDAFVMSEMARQLLLSDGYEAVGIDHFARPGDALIRARARNLLRRDFQGYSDTAATTLIGLGASAISRFPAGFVQNASATSLYINSISSGSLAGDRGYHLTEVDLVIGAMIEMLMCRFEIDVTEISRRFPGHEALIRRATQNIIAVFGAHVLSDPDRLRVRQAARPMARLMAHVLDQLGRTHGLRPHPQSAKP